MAQMSLSTEQKQTHRQRTDLCLWGAGGRGGKDWESGISRGKLLYIGWINNKVILYSTGNCTHYSVTNHNGKEYIYICITESLCCTEGINIVNQLYFNKI